MMYKLKDYKKLICKDPIIKEPEDLWNGYPTLIPCGKCTVCIRNLEAQKDINKIYEIEKIAKGVKYIDTALL